MAQLILNEWLWADLDSAEETRQRAALGAILALDSKSDRFVVVEGSPFATKLWRFCRAASSPERKSAARILTSLVWDATRCIKLAADALPELPEALAYKCNPDDHYLLKAYLAVQEGLIVSTDGPLLSVLGEEKWNALHRDDWLQAYLESDV